VICATSGGSGTDAGEKMKSTGGLWSLPNFGATNSSRFSAIPGGYRDPIGAFALKGNSNYFWSSMNYNSVAINRNINKNSSQIYRDSNEKRYGFSIRCLKD
jgi:uncharacterized protein (TIGR02145 family)